MAEGTDNIFSGIFLSTLTFPNKEYPIHNHHQPRSADGPHSPLHSIYPGLSAKLNDMKSLYVLHVVLKKPWGR